MIQHKMWALLGTKRRSLSKPFPAGLPAAMVPGGRGRWPRRRRRGSSGRGRGGVEKAGKRLVELGVFMFKVMVDGCWYVDITICYVYLLTYIVLKKLRGFYSISGMRLYGHNLCRNEALETCVDERSQYNTFTFYMWILGTRWIIDHHSAIGLEHICPRRILRSIYDDSKYSIICKAGR